MKRRAVLFILVLVLCAASASLAEGKYTTAPDIFRINLRVEERVNGVPKSELPVKETKYRTYVRKEYLVTANPIINEKAAAIVDAFDAMMSPVMKEEDKPSSIYSSRLDIEVVYTISGHTVSILVLARETYQRAQLRSLFQTAVYDLETGDELTLRDLFTEDSAAWEIIAKGMRAQLGEMFPSEPRNTDAIDRLAARGTLEKTGFTLSGGELTLHFQACVIYPGKANILHVRLPYTQLSRMFTDTGKRATDNSRWKMVALTFDDGPNYTEKSAGGSRWALPLIRAAGWRVTYFIWGKNIPGAPDILMAEADNNHSMQNHSLWHPYGNEVTSAGNVIRQTAGVDELMLDVIGVRTTAFRAPFGAYVSWLRYGIDMPVIQWSIDPKDPTVKIPGTIVKRIADNIHDGAIVLLHDTRKATTASIPSIMELLRDEGYMVVTVDELASINGVVLEAGVVYEQIEPAVLQ